MDNVVFVGLGSLTERDGFCCCCFFTLDRAEKYGKDFHDIRQDFLTWKTPSALIEYYYLWKTTDRYVQQKRVKAVEAESKLKQVRTAPSIKKIAEFSFSNWRNGFKTRSMMKTLGMELYWNMFNTTNWFLVEYFSTEIAL